LDDADIICAKGQNAISRISETVSLERHLAVYRDVGIALPAKGRRDAAPLC